VWDEVHWKWGN